MFLYNNILLILAALAITGSAIFGFFWWMTFLRKKAVKKPSLPTYRLGLIICMIISISVLLMTIIAPILWAFCFSALFGPIVFFAFNLNRELIRGAKKRSRFKSIAYKTIITFVIWFIALFPLSLIGVTQIIRIPQMIIYNHEIGQLREKIKNYETFADLTPFGLGVYKLEKPGSNYLWDITKPQRFMTEWEGERMVYENCFNRKDDATWDKLNAGKNVMCDVIFYEGTYIIIPPLWEETGEGNIYLCKEISANADLFNISAFNSETVAKLLELPGEKMTREELSEKLGKAM